MPALMVITTLGCHTKNEEPSESRSSDVPRAIAAGHNVAAVENPLATPVKDRVATLGLLNKRNNEEQDLVLKSGESRRVGNVVVKLATCEKTAPWEQASEIGAFVQVFVEERASVAEPLAWHKVFSGWLFRNAPSLNVVEHPVYDVWVKDCAMRFPGEEESPGDFATHAPTKPVSKPVAAPTPGAGDASPGDGTSPPP